MTFTPLRQVAADLRSALADFDPERLSGPDAARALELFSEIEKLASGGTILAARRVESSNIWRGSGHRSAAAHIAEATGTGLGPAITTLQAARQLDSLPATEEAMRAGRLSETQVKEIAGAAILQPDAEQELVRTAEKQPLTTLKLRCRRVKAAGRDQTPSYDAIRRGRYLRNWTDGDGAVRFDARLTPDEGARLVAVVKAEADRLSAQAKRAGLDESRAAVSVDALVRLACGDSGGGPGTGTGTGGGGAGEGGGSHHPDDKGNAEPVPADVTGTRSDHGGPSAMIHVRVDHQALMRGHLEPGEICEIPGIGPVPVGVARRLAIDSILEILVTDGTDVTAVAHAGRSIPAALRRALVERDQVCVVPGCDVRDALEIDHVDPFASGGPASMDNLVRLCHWHHYLKTHHRHRLIAVGDGWEWVPPAGRSGGPPPDDP